LQLWRSGYAKRGMFILFGVIALIFIIAAIRVVLPAIQRHRIASELRRDWWPAFEREFRAYASGSWGDAREAEQHS